MVTFSRFTASSTISSGVNSFSELVSEDEGVELPSSLEVGVSPLQAARPNPESASKKMQQ